MTLARHLKAACLTRGLTSEQPPLKGSKNTCGTQGAEPNLTPTVGRVSVHMSVAENGLRRSILAHARPTQGPKDVTQLSLRGPKVQNISRWVAERLALVEILSQNSNLSSGCLARAPTGMLGTGESNGLSSTPTCSSACCVTRLSHIPYNWLLDEAAK